jgi:hypothetical protein
VQNAPGTPIEAVKDIDTWRDALCLAIRRGVLPAVQIDRRTKMVRRADVERYRQDHLRKRGPRAKGEATRERDQ